MKASPTVSTGPPTAKASQMPGSKERADGEGDGDGEGDAHAAKPSQAANASERSGRRVTRAS
jgi:hypothetical protein